MNEQSPLVAIKFIEASAEVQSSVSPAPGRVTEKEQYLSNERNESSDKHDPYEIPKDILGMNTEAAGKRKQLIRNRLERFQQELRAQLYSIFLVDQDGNLKCEDCYGFDNNGNLLQSEFLSNEECSLDDVGSLLIKAISPTGRTLPGGEKSIYGRPIVLDPRECTASSVFNMAANQLEEVMHIFGETFSACFMPINGSNRSYGVIRILNKGYPDNKDNKYPSFSEDDIYLVSLFAANLATDLKRAKSADQGKLILFLQNLLLHSCKKSKSLDQNIKIYKEMLCFVVKYLTTTDFSCVKSAHLRIQLNGKLRTIASCTNGEKGDKDKTDRSANEDSIVARVYNDCHDLRIYNYQQHYLFTRSKNKNWIIENKFRDVLCVALKVDEYCIGTISFFTGQHQILAKEDCRFLRIISNILASLLASGVQQDDTSNSLDGPAEGVERLEELRSSPPRILPKLTVSDSIARKQTTYSLISNLDRLARASGTTKADVIVRAFRLYEKTLEEASKGNVIRYIPEAEVRRPNARSRPRRY